VPTQLPQLFSDLAVPFQGKRHLLLGWLMIMAMAGQLQRLLLQLVLKFSLVHGCLYVYLTLEVLLHIGSFCS
jgi:hypothetical protein